MIVKAMDAANAYGRSMQLPAVGEGSAAGGVSAAGAGGPNFASFLADTLEQVSTATKAAEVESARAVAGQADLVDVVTAVNSAEMALETMVAVRDRVISAYQEIMRMPI